MPNHAQPLCHLSINLAKNWPRKFGSVADRYAFVTSEPVNAPKVDLERIIVHELAYSLWVLKVQLNSDDIFCEAEHFPCKVQLADVRLFTRVHFELECLND